MGTFEDAVAGAVDEERKALGAVVKTVWQFQGVTVLGGAVFQPHRPLMVEEKRALKAAGFTRGVWRARNRGSQHWGRS